MKILFIIIFVSLLSLTRIDAQSPTKQQTFEFLRTKLLAFSDVRNVTFDVNNCTLTYMDGGGAETNVIYISNLDANGLAWDLNNSDYCITIAGKLNTVAETHDVRQAKGMEDYCKTHPTCYVTFGAATLCFSSSKASSDPDFQNSMTKAIEHLIELCGGTKKTKLF